MFKKNEEKNKTFIGFYKLSVLLTYTAVISGSVGIYLALSGKIIYALICLMLSGICDAFDGKVARKCKRSEDEKSFGIQIDSLADMVSFIFLPVCIFYGLGLTRWYNVVVFVLFVLFGVIRLAYFNVIAETSGKNNGVSYYSGLPVTSTAIIFPLVYFIKSLVLPLGFNILYTLTMLFVAILFVLNFKLKKPKGTILYVFLGCAVVVSVLLFLLGK